MTIWHEVEFPDRWLNPRFVETVSGSFTIQIDSDGKGQFTEDDRLELVRLTRLVLENISGKPVEPFQKLES